MNDRHIEFLFQDEIPCEVKHVFVNGKKISTQEFIEAKKKKSKKEKNSNMNFREFLQILLILLLSIILFLFLKK